MFYKDKGNCSDIDLDNNLTQDEIMEKISSENKTVLVDLLLRNGFTFNRYVLLKIDSNNKFKSFIINPREVSKKIKKKIENYSYYSIINGYKSVFKDKNNNYKPNVTFEEIFALYEFDKNIKAIFLKFTLEIEVIIKSLMANTLAKKYGVQEYLVVKNKKMMHKLQRTTYASSLILIKEKPFDFNFFFFLRNF